MSNFQIIRYKTSLDLDPIPSEKDLEEGKIYHTLQYGKGLMGSHASQMSQKERWQVIEYVKCLQKGITSPEFDSKGMLKMPAASADADSTKKI